MDTCEQKYKDALKRAKECHIDGLSLHQPVKDVIEYIFPELKESEDEKVRKEILGLVQYTKGRKIGYEPRIHQDEILAWLEKQGEQKPAAKYKVGDTVYYDSFGRLVSFVITNIVEDGTGNPMYEDKDGNSIFQNELVEQKPANEVEPFDKYKGLTDFERTLADICIGWIGEELGWKQYIKDNADVLLKIAFEKFNSMQNVLSFEPKFAWGEEDEDTIEKAICVLEANFETCEEFSGLDIKRYQLVDRLKSLKERYTWRPSGAQIASLTIACDRNDRVGFDLTQLLKDLKRLKG